MSGDGHSVPHCWCGGELGPRFPGDENGMGCLDNVMHSASPPKQHIVSVEFVFTRDEDDEDAYLNLDRIRRGPLREGTTEADLTGIGESFAQVDRYQIALAQIGDVIDGDDVVKP